MLANRHYMLDAYGCFVEQSNSVMVVNDLLVQLATSLKLKPLMPPFLIPYYYCQDPEDVGVSAFCICANGSHITIHTFPYRSCYFVDILTDQFFSEEEVTGIIRNQIYASNINTNVMDRRVFEGVSGDMDIGNDFGPHYMITVKDVDVTMDGLFKWLDNVAPRINMQAISRPYVIYDRPQNPRYISGVLVVAQSHIAFHYDIAARTANIDIFSCSFLENGTVEYILQQSFGEDVSINLFARGSKYHWEREKHTRTARIERDSNWQENIL